MGNSRFDDDDFKAFTSRTTKGRSREEIFARQLDQYLDPHAITVRESRDSEANPESTPIIVALDVTGSMGEIAEIMARKGLRELMNSLYETRPVPDPHLMVMAIGDVECDGAPLQVSQFEADTKIGEQLQKIYLEGGGGGNNCESYTLPWWFAVNKIQTDAWAKRRKKGYIFTIGDEMPNYNLSARKTKNKTGLEAEEDVKTENLLEQVQEQWIPYHIMVAQGNYMSSRPEQVKKAWEDLLKEKAIVLEDKDQLAATILKAIKDAEEGNVPTAPTLNLRS